MDVHIGEINSNVRAIDSQMLLDERVIERLTAILMKRVQERMDHDKRVEEERQPPSNRAFEDK
jgi:hypothetical protein